MLRSCRVFASFVGLPASRGGRCSTAATTSPPSVASTSEQTPNDTEKERKKVTMKKKYQLPSLREEFTMPAKLDWKVWFPLHMSVQFQKMEARLRAVDLIIEVHDARLPVTGRNSTFQQQLYSIRPHILVMNKMDLIDLRRYQRPIEEYHRERGVKSIVWTDCRKRSRGPLRVLHNTILELLEGEASARFNRAQRSEYNIMVVGIPNVGKSSVINSLRAVNMSTTQSAVVEGARPGVTTRLQNKVRISDKPLIYIVDTPGVLQPSAQRGTDAVKLALANLLLETLTVPTVVADYLLFWLNTVGDFSYVKLLNLPDGPTDDVKHLLREICRANNLRVTRTLSGHGPVELWDDTAAIKLFLELYRKHKLRDHCLDREHLLPYL